MRKIDLLGRRFGRLVVMSETEKRGRHLRWLCQCACGDEVAVDGVNLRAGHTKSCGCLNREMTPTRALKHGKTGTRVYWAWSNMHRRCSDPTNEQWDHYGGRGIAVCQRWHIFDDFLADMGEPAEGESLDRIDVNGNYEPSNCRWIGVVGQRRNMRSNRLIEWRGREKCLAEWSEELGISRNTLTARLGRGMTVDEAFTLPVVGRDA